jgi:hypothetical protein
VPDRFVLVGGNPQVASRQNTSPNHELLVSGRSVTVGLEHLILVTSPAAEYGLQISFQLLKFCHESLEIVNRLPMCFSEGGSSGCIIPGGGVLRGP